MQAQQKQRFSLVFSTAIADSLTGSITGNLNFNVNFKLFLDQEKLQKQYKIYTRFCTDETTDATIGLDEVVLLSVNLGTSSLIQMNTTYSNICGILERTSNNVIKCDVTSNPPFYVKTLVDVNSINVKLLLSDLNTTYSPNLYTLILHFEEV